MGGKCLDCSVRDVLFIAVSSGGHAIVIQIYSGHACTRVKVHRLGQQRKTALKRFQVFEKHKSLSNGALRKNHSKQSAQNELFAICLFHFVF